MNTTLTVSFKTVTLGLLFGKGGILCVPNEMASVIILKTQHIGGSFKELKFIVLTQMSYHLLNLKWMGEWHSSEEKSRLKNINTTGNLKPKYL